MYLEISNPMDYHVALYIRLSKEDETEGPSQSVTNQKSLLKELINLTISNGCIIGALKHRVVTIQCFIRIFGMR